MFVVSVPWAEKPARRVCLAMVSPVKTLLVGSSLDDFPGMRNLLVLKEEMLDRRSLLECVAEKDRTWTLERVWREYCRIEMRAWWDWRSRWLTLWS